MDVDLATFKRIVSFSPTDSHISFKMLLNDRVSSQFMGKLLRSQTKVLEPYISPYEMEEVESWFKQPGFFEWLVLPDSFHMTLYKAKEDAANTLVEMMNPLPTDDPKMLSIRLKAAELVLKSELRKENKTTTNNTIKVSSQNIPKHLLSKSVENLEDSIKALKQ